MFELKVNNMINKRKYFNNKYVLYICTRLSPIRENEIHYL